jgi:hypothetical protein
MSRSKKFPIWKDSPSKESKRIANKRFRQKERQSIHHGEEPPLKSRELTNPYDLCDYKFFPRNKKDSDRAARK